MLAVRAFVRCTVLSCVLLILLVAVPTANARAISRGFTHDEIDRMRLEGRKDLDIAQSLYGIPAPSFLHPSAHERNHKSIAHALADYMSSKLPGSSLKVSEGTQDFELVPGQAAAKAEQVHQQRLVVQSQQSNTYLPAFLRRSRTANLEALEREIESQRDRLRPKWIVGS